MIPLLDSTRAKELDKYLIDEIEMPPSILMENAARSSSEIIQEELEIGSSVALLCGSGNNGGDGFALARHLSVNYEVDIVWLGSESKMSEETRLNFDLCNNLQIPVHKISDLNIGKIEIDSDCIIDCLIGIGFEGELKSIHSELLQKVNETESLKIAIDIPTGLNSETGKADKNVFIADLTITMFSPKIGLLLNDGIDISGEVISTDIGTQRRFIENYKIGDLIEVEDVNSILPFKSENISKFNNGNLAIFAGSRSMPGAAALCANASISSGAGLVTLATINPSSNLMSEVMVLNADESNSGSFAESNQIKFSKLAENSDAIAIGPGMGKERKTQELIKSLISQFESKKIILDADAPSVINSGSKLNQNFVLTPHSGELSRMLAIPRLDIEKDPVFYVKKAAKQFDCTVLLKGSTSLIANNNKLFLDLNGNNGMATAGSGDVLTGFIASFMAQGLSPIEATICGVNLHGRAGDSYVKSHNKFSLTASDLIKEFAKLEI